MTNPYQQMAAGNHSIGVIKSGELIATDAEVYMPPDTERQATLYLELLYAVGNKYPNESRHETALRYIRQAEQHGSAWVSVNDYLPDEGVPILLLHRNGAQWTGYKGMERPGFEDTFQPYPYFIDTGEHEMWEWGDIVLWRHLPVVDHVSFAAEQEQK